MELIDRDQAAELLEIGVNKLRNIIIYHKDAEFPEHVCKNRFKFMYEKMVVLQWKETHDVEDYPWINHYKEESVSTSTFDLSMAAKLLRMPIFNFNVGNKSKSTRVHIAGEY